MVAANSETLQEQDQSTEDSHDSSALPNGEEFQLGVIGTSSQHDSWKTIYYRLPPLLEGKQF